MAIQSLTHPLVDGGRCLLSMDLAYTRTYSDIVHLLGKRSLVIGDVSLTEFCRLRMAQFSGCNVGEITDSHPRTISDLR